MGRLRREGNGRRRVELFATYVRRRVASWNHGVRFAYADPPYVGMARRHYGEVAREVNHALLIQHLVDDYPDGWALSLSAQSLERILTTARDIGLDLMRGDYRVCAWVKPWCAFKPRVKVAYCWEPVLVRGGRPREREEDTTRDWVAANITMQRGVIGAKPDKFCWWLFSVWNAQPGDELHDLFPGSGAVSKAWVQWTRGPQQLELAAP